MSAQDGRASNLPTNAWIADHLRAGETMEHLADRLGVSVTWLRIRLNDAGWGSDGHPTHEPTAEAAPGDLFQWPPWVDRALCAQTDPEAFFPEKGGSTREAKAVCARCPVQAECIDYALERGERFGIWGGFSEQERRKVLKQMHRPQQESA